MLLGTQITVHTDHKNLTFWTMLMKQVLCWQLYLEEFDVTLLYIEGEKNLLADCFLNHPKMSKLSVGEKEQLMIERNKGTLVEFQKLKVREALENATKYINKEINKIYVLCVIKTPNKPEEMNWKICLPNLHIHEAIRWYYLLVGQPRLTYSIMERFYHTFLTQYCKEYR